MTFIRGPAPILADAGEPAPLAGPLVFDITERQLECLAWAEAGKTAAEIGVILGISSRTVETHLARACMALGVHRRIQAVVKARQLGVMPALTR
jgi:DNA-binding CsgD family transcriptional regulator